MSSRYIASADQTVHAANGQLINQDEGTVVRFRSDGQPSCHPLRWLGRAETRDRAISGVGPAGR